MPTVISQNITLPRFAVNEKEGVVFLPLKVWKTVEMELEDLEMYRSAHLAKEIKKRRIEKKSILLKTLLKKYRI